MTKSRMKQLGNSRNRQSNAYFVRVILTAIIPLLFQYIHGISLAKKCNLPGKGGRKSSNFEPTMIGDRIDLPIVTISCNQFAAGTRRSLSHGRIKRFDG